MSSFVQKITVISSFMSIRGSDRRPGNRKTCRRFGISYHPAHTQTFRLLTDYMLSGREIYFDRLMSCLIEEDKFRICVPASDAITGELGEGVEEILGMRSGEHV
jgi:hypothetical protein